MRPQCRPGWTRSRIGSFMSAKPRIMLVGWGRSSSPWISPGRSWGLSSLKAIILFLSILTLEWAVGLVAVGVVALPPVDHSWAAEGVFPTAQVARSSAKRLLMGQSLMMVKGALTSPTFLPTEVLMGRRSGTFTAIQETTPSLSLMGL